MPCSSILHRKVSVPVLEETQKGMQNHPGATTCILKFLKNTVANLKTNWGVHSLCHIDTISTFRVPRPVSILVMSSGVQSHCDNSTMRANNSPCKAILFVVVIFSDNHK